MYARDSCRVGRYSAPIKIYKLKVNGVITRRNQWIRLRLPSYRLRFESHAHHRCFYQFIFELCHVGRIDENKQKKRMGLPHFLKKLAANL